ncbi:MAG: SpaA isopeptide-forming pilin-related protein, partial [Weissella confusa]|nr:SpaA isopeptide-forming pilin-related protein [Weissella confusa]
MHKVDETTGNPLAGAVFKLVDAKGRTVKENLTTDESGTIHSGVLRPGDYAFIETKAPTGYVLDTTPVRFTVVDGQLVTLDLTMFNHQPRNISVSGQRTWQDQNNLMNTRPDTTTVDLYRHGQKIDSQRVSAATQWQYHFDNLPGAADNGTPYDYTVREEKVAGYTTEQNGYNFTNVLNPIEPIVPNQ